MGPNLLSAQYSAHSVHWMWMGCWCGKLNPAPPTLPRSSCSSYTRLSSCCSQPCPICLHCGPVWHSCKAFRFCPWAAFDWALSWETFFLQLRSQIYSPCNVKCNVKIIRHIAASPLAPVCHCQTSWKIHTYSFSFPDWQQPFSVRSHICTLKVATLA